MQQVDATTWELRLTTLARHLEWKPLLDDQTWAKGANDTVDPGATSVVQPRFFHDTGTWSRAWPSFASTLLGNTRGVWVYLPPSYPENTAARYPVIYMHDGQNLFDPSAAFGGNTWKVADTLDAAANDGSFEEAIVVGPENTADRIPEYTPVADPGYGGGHGDLYLRMLVEELKPKVDAELRTRPERTSTTLLGSSLGGLISAWAGITRADTFGRIGVMSPSTWWDNDWLVTQVPLTPATGTGRPLAVYVDSGDSGDSNDDVDLTRQLAQAYRDAGFVDEVTFKYLVQPGGTHTESAWASRLPGALQFLQTR
jgi:predicted alpha/beta superfamily hydrolase